MYYSLCYGCVPVDTLQVHTMCAVSQAMVMFHGKEKFSRDLFDILSKLATDDNVAVRQSIAYGIHEVIVCVLCVPAHALQDPICVGSCLYVLF